MLSAVSGASISERRLLLLGLACIRLAPQTGDASSERLLDAMEKYADGEITRGQLDEQFEREAAHDGVAFGVFDLDEARLYLSGALDAGADPLVVHGLLRDIFGNPFRPVAFDPAWRTTDAAGLARTIYESRDFAPMPVLADALEEAGCDSPGVLAHCRGDGPHVRGCWVVDLVLGKS